MLRPLFSRRPTQPEPARRTILGSAAAAPAGSPGGLYFDNDFVPGEPSSGEPDASQQPPGADAEAYAGLGVGLFPEQHPLPDAVPEDPEPARSLLGLARNPAALWRRVQRYTATFPLPMPFAAMASLENFMRRPELESGLSLTTSSQDLSCTMQYTEQNGISFNLHKMRLSQPDLPIRVTLTPGLDSLTLMVNHKPMRWLKIQNLLTCFLTPQSSTFAMYSLLLNLGSPYGTHYSMHTKMMKNDWQFTLAGTQHLSRHLTIGGEAKLSSLNVSSLFMPPGQAAQSPPIMLECTAQYRMGGAMYRVKSGIFPQFVLKDRIHQVDGRGCLEMYIQMATLSAKLKAALHPNGTMGFFGMLSFLRDFKLSSTCTMSYLGDLYLDPHTYEALFGHAVMISFQEMPMSVHMSMLPSLDMALQLQFPMPQVPGMTLATSIKGSPKGRWVRPGLSFKFQG